MLEHPFRRGRDFKALKFRCGAIARRMRIGGHGPERSLMVYVQVPRLVLPASNIEDEGPHSRPQVGYDNGNFHTAFPG